MKHVHPTSTVRVSTRIALQWTPESEWGRLLPIKNLDFVCSSCWTLRCHFLCIYLEITNYDWTGLCLKVIMVSPKLKYDWTSHKSMIDWCVHCSSAAVWLHVWMDVARQSAARAAPSCIWGENMSAAFFMFLSFSHTAPTGQAQLCCNWLSPTEFSGGFRLQLHWEAYYTLLHTYTLQTAGSGGGGGVSEFIWRIHSLSVDSNPAGCSDKNQKLTKKCLCVCVSRCVRVWVCDRVCQLWVSGCE